MPGLRWRWFAPGRFRADALRSVRRDGTDPRVTPVECLACGWWHPQDRVCARCAALGAPIAPAPVVLSGPLENSGAEALIRQQSANGGATGDTGRSPGGDQEPAGPGQVDPDDTRPVEPTGPYGQPKTPVETPVGGGSPGAPCLPPEVGEVEPGKVVGVIRYRDNPRGGRLRVGGTNKGGPGRPRNEVRARALRLTDESLDFLDRVISGVQLEQHVTMFGGVVETEPKVRDRLAAIAQLVRIATLGQAAEEAPASAERRTLRVVWEQLAERTG